MEVAEHQTPLKDFLAKRGLSMREVASAVKVTETTVSRWRNRITPPSPEHRKAFIAAFEPTRTELRKLGWPEAKKEAARV